MSIPIASFVWKWCNWFLGDAIKIYINYLCTFFLNIKNCRQSRGLPAIIYHYMYQMNGITQMYYSSSRKASISCEIDFLLRLYVVVVLRLFHRFFCFLWLFATKVQPLISFSIKELYINLSFVTNDKFYFYLPPLLLSYYVCPSTQE